MVEQHVSLAKGGPFDGREITYDMDCVSIPIWNGKRDKDPNSLRYGDPVFDLATYRWIDGVWLYQTARH